MYLSNPLVTGPLASSRALRHGFSFFSARFPPGRHRGGVKCPFARRGQLVRSDQGAVPSLQPVGAGARIQRPRGPGMPLRCAGEAPAPPVGDPARRSAEEDSCSIRSQERHNTRALAAKHPWEEKEGAGIVREERVNDRAAVVWWISHGFQATQHPCGSSRRRVGLAHPRREAGAGVQHPLSVREQNPSS